MKSMRKPSCIKYVKNLLPFAFICLFGQNGFCSSWKPVSPGIGYLDLYSSYLTPWSHVHVLKIDPHKYRFKLALARVSRQNHASVDTLAEENNAVIAFNGGFFDKQYQPLGLRISAGIRMNPIKRISWWGIFYIRRMKAFIASPNDHIPVKHLDFALQSGPRLIINNRIPPLKPGRAKRTAMGIDPQGNIIVVVTDNVSLSTTELAELMKAPPLQCRNALNLDGGSSSQLLVNLADFKLNVHGFSNVSDAVVVVPR